MMTSLRMDQAAAMTVDEVIEACRTSLQSGLSPDEAKHRLSVHGPNTFEITKEEPLWKKYLNQVSAWCSGHVCGPCLSSLFQWNCTCWPDCSHVDLPVKLFKDTIFPSSSHWVTCRLKKKVYQEVALVWFTLLYNPLNGFCGTASV